MWTKLAWFLAACLLVPQRAVGFQRAVGLQPQRAVGWSRSWSTLRSSSGYEGMTVVLTYSLTHSLVHSLAYSLTHLLTYSLTHLLTYSLTHSLTFSLAHSLTQVELKEALKERGLASSGLKQVLIQRLQGACMLATDGVLVLTFSLLFLNRK